MKIKTGVNFHNRFDIVKNGEWVGCAENIILNQMYNRICNLNSYFVNIHFGTGTGTPTPERTSLFSHLGTKAAVNEEKIKAMPTSKWTRKIVLNPEQYVGQTITEVGIAYGSGESTLVTHAMIKDAEGNPLSIYKTDTDIIEIYATVFVTLEDSPGIFWDKAPRGNEVLDYLLGGSLLGGANLLTSSNDIKTNVVHGVRGDPDIWVSPTTNVANRKITYFKRLGVNQLNRNTAMVGLSGIVGTYIDSLGVLPYSAHNIHVDIGDGTKTQFILPKKAENIVVKVDNDIATDYTIENFADPEVVPLNIQSDVIYALRLNASSSKVCALSDGVYLAVVPIITSLPNANAAKVVVKFKIENGIPKTLQDFVVSDSHNTSVTISSDKKTLRYSASDLGTTYVSVETFKVVSNPGGTFSGFIDVILEEGWEWYVAGLRRTDDTSGRRLVFNSPPPDGSIITVDCSLPYLPKTEDYVLDTTFEIQFGEGA